MPYVYLIECSGYYKIGIASDVERRLAELQTGNPADLTIDTCYEFSNVQAVETVLHQKYSAKRRRGEWFELTLTDIAEFHSACLVLGGVYYSPKSYRSSEADVEEAENASEWIELVKVKQWYYLRLMRWDDRLCKKIYVRNLGSLEDCKNNPEYSDEAYRLAALRFPEKVVL
jgi:hypothetical protein